MMIMPRPGKRKRAPRNRPSKGKRLTKGRAKKKKVVPRFKSRAEKDIKHIYTSVRWDATDMLSFFKTMGFDRSDFINLRKGLE